MWFFLLIAVAVVIWQAPGDFWLTLAPWLWGGIAFLAFLAFGGFLIGLFSKKDPALEIGPIDALPSASETKNFQGFTDAALIDPIPVAAIDRRIYGRVDEKRRPQVTDEEDAEEEDRLRLQQEFNDEDAERRAQEEAEAREREKEKERQWTETWDDGYDDRGRETSRY